MRVPILTLLFFTSYCLSTVNGLSIREATEATIDETMTVFSNIAEDKNFTDFQPKINNKTEDIIPANGSVEVTNNTTEKEKEKAKVNIVAPSSSTTINATSKPTDGLNIPSTTLSTTTTTTTTPVPSTSSSPLNTSMAISPFPLNDTNPIVDLSAVNDTVANAIFTDLEELLTDLNDSNATSIDNGIDTAAGGVPGGSPDEFASYFELLDKLDGLEVLFEPDQ